MKKTRLFYSLLMFLMMTTVAWGISNVTGKWHGSQTALILDTDTRIDVNNLEMFVYNDGNFAYDNANVLGKTDGLYFPRGTKKTVIYSAGLWIGAQVSGDTRLAIAEYSSEFTPGPMANGTYQPDNAAFRVYKVAKSDNANSNPDYANWPADQGAPVDAEGKPLILGNQMAWSVFNDADPAGHINDAASTAPLGLEVQMSAFGFARGGALGNTVFFKYVIINKGTNTLDSTFVSLWADPDLGNASDDLVGCDTLLSLGYCFNEGDDANYGAAPPAVGFDFFEGPIVPSEGDSALVNGVWRQGFRNLPMASFNKYINGTDPASRVETYGYMKGLTKDPITGDMIPAINPSTGLVTTYSVSGDPVTQTGWVDEAAADRRYMMSAGPFTMAPGDTQEVVAAVIVAQGSSPLNSITALKAADIAAQAVFDLNFDIPDPPPSPSVFLRGVDGAVEMIWGTEPVGNVEANEKLGQEFHFEGYNLYQGESANGPWTKFATYDIDHDDQEEPVSLIYGDVVDATAGGTQRVILQKGSNSGLVYNQTVTNSQITGVALKNNQPYYFAVTAYSYDYLNITPFSDAGGNFLGYITETLESPIIPYMVKPFTFVGEHNQTATQIPEGGSDGVTTVEYINPGEVTGDSYEVTFNEDLTWNLRNTTTGTLLLENIATQADDYGYPVVEGIQVRVVGPTPGIKAYEWVGDRWISGVDAGLPQFFGALGNAADFFGSSVGPLDYKDVEIRWSFTATQKGHFYVRSGAPLCGGSYCYNGFFDVPFTVWDVSTVPERQLNVLIAEQYGNACFDSTWLPCDEAGTGREYLFVTNSTYTGTANPTYASQNMLNDAADMDVLYSLWPRVRPGHVPADELADGQKLIITKNNPNNPAVRYTFTTVKPEAASGDDVLITSTLDQVKTVPNPYYAFYPEESDQFDRIVKFINLPPNQAMKIKIYNIAGDLLRTLERSGGSSDPEFVWDLKTEAGLWVASGIYIWVIEADGLGTKFGKMAIFPEVEQLDTF